MLYSVDEILGDVRLMLDENTEGEVFLSSVDDSTVQVDEIIRSKIEDGVRQVEMSVPLYMLESGHHIGNDDDGGSDGYGELSDGSGGFVMLPEDFMRLISFKMSDWLMSVREPIGTDDKLYKYQKSRFAGLRGTKERPVCAIAMNPAGRMLEFYPLTDGAEIESDTYLPEPKVCGGYIDICERCYKACVYYIAALVRQTLGGESAELLEIAKSLMK